MEWVTCSMWPPFLQLTVTPALCSRPLGRLLLGANGYGQLGRDSERIPKLGAFAGRESYQCPSRPGWFYA